MAVERGQQLLQLNLGDLVSTRISQLSKVVEQIRARKESDFQSSINENNLTLEEQIAYRQGLIEKENTRKVVDTDFIKSQKVEVSSLKKRSRWQKYQDDFMSALAEYKAGRQTAEQHLEFLQNRLLNTSDADIKNDLLSRIVESEDSVRADYENMLNNKIQYAQESGQSKELEKVINLAHNERGKAISRGDATLVSLYDVKIQTLTQELRSAKIKDEEVDIDLKVLGGGDITDKLNWFSNKISTAVPGNAFVVDGTKYDSEAQYWQTRQAQFINDEYFTNKSKQLQNKVTAWYNKFGDISSNNLIKLRNEVNSILGNPALAPYAGTLGVAFSQGVLQSALGLKLQRLNDRLTVENSIPGVANIANEVLNLQKLIPEISQNASYTALESQYSEKVMNLLKTKIETFTGAKQEEITSLSNILAEDITLDENQRKAIQLSLAKQQSDLSLLTSKANLTDIPSTALTFGSNPNDVFNTLLSDYRSLTQSIDVGALPLEDYQKTLLGGLQKQQKLGLETTTPTGTPKTGATPLANAQKQLKVETPNTVQPKPSVQTPKQSDLIYITNPEAIKTLGEGRIWRESTVNPNSQKVYALKDKVQYIDDPKLFSSIPGSQRVKLDNSPKVYKLL